MKWLFAILVALNIIIFANVVTQRMQNKEEAVVQEIPSTPAEVIMVREEIIDNISSEVVEPSIEQQIATRKVQKEAQKKQESNKPVTVKSGPVVNEQVAKRLASCTAQITIPEDAYHRLKGMLNRWPNAASRVVVKNENADIMGRQYQVLFPSPDAADAAKEASSKGFNAQAAGNIVTLGVFKERAPAEALLDKARAAGYGQANVMERSLGGKENLSEAKYKILFLQVDSQTTMDINAIVKPYGSLERGACQR